MGLVIARTALHIAQSIIGKWITEEVTEAGTEDDMSSGPQIMRRRIWRCSFGRKLSRDVIVSHRIEGRSESERSAQGAVRDSLTRWIGYWV